LLRCSTRQSRIPQLHNFALRRLRRRRTLLDSGSRRSLLNRGNLLGRSRSNLLSRSRSNLLGRSRSNLLDLNNGSNLLDMRGGSRLSRSHDGLLYNSRDRITMVRHVIYLTTKKIFKINEKFLKWTNIFMISW
jgi:hypothetical protein